MKEQRNVSWSAPALCPQLPPELHPFPFGNVLRTNRYELAGWQFASQIAETDDGGFLLAGFSMSSGSRRQADTWLAHCTATGELEWETSFGDSAHDDYATSLIRLRDGSYLIGGIGNGMLLSRVD